jgi:hypothetical protein
VPAFFMASFAEKKFPAIMLCVETLLVCVISYYWIESLVNSHPFIWGGYYFYLWMICAVAAGIAFGLAAFYRKQKSKWYYWGTSILPAVFFAEGMDELIHLPDYMHMIPAVIGRIIIGAALYLIIYKKDFCNRKSIISFCVLSALGVIGYEILFILTI